MIKKSLALLLVLCMLLCMSACGTKDTVSEISSDITPNETTQSQIEETTDNTESEVSTPTTTTPSQTQVVVQPTPQPTPQPQHTHSYTTAVKAATCTEQGYTTYTCSCGDTYNADYVTPSHKYENYKCSMCGAIDKEHTYDYLKNWIKENGKTEGQLCEIVTTSENYYNCETALIYQAQNDSIIFHLSYLYEELLCSTYVYLDKISDAYLYSSVIYIVEDGITARKITGKIKCNGFTDKTPLTYDSYTSEIDVALTNNSLELARVDLSILLLGIEAILTGDEGSLCDSGLRLSDLGFDKFIESTGVVF